MRTEAPGLQFNEKALVAIELHLAGLGMHFVIGGIYQDTVADGGLRHFFFAGEDLAEDSRAQYGRSTLFDFGIDFAGSLFVFDLEGHLGGGKSFAISEDRVMLVDTVAEDQVFPAANCFVEALDHVDLICRGDSLTSLTRGG